MLETMEEQTDLCDPGVQAVWGIPCIGESKLPIGSYRPNCDVLRELQRMCKDQEIYFIKPKSGKSYLEEIDRCK